MDSRDAVGWPSVVFHAEGTYRRVGALDSSRGRITASALIDTLRGPALAPSVPSRGPSSLNISVVDGRPTIIEHRPSSLRRLQCNRLWSSNKIYSGRTATTRWFLWAYFASDGATSDSPWIVQLIRMAKLPIQSPEDIAAQRLRICTKDSSLLLAGISDKNIVIARATLNVDRWVTIGFIRTGQPIADLALVSGDKIAAFNETGCALFSLRSPHQN